MVPVGPGSTVSPHPFVFPQMSKSDNFGEKMKEFMQKYDKNSDGKIEMAEVSPTSWLRAMGERGSCHLHSAKHKCPSRPLKGGRGWSGSPHPTSST